MNCDNLLCTNLVYEISDGNDPVKFCENCKKTGLNFNSRYQYLETPVDPSDGPCTTEILFDSMINQWWYQCNDCPVEKSNLCVYCSFNCMKNFHSLKLQFGPVVCNTIDNKYCETNTDNNIRKPDKQIVERLIPNPNELPPEFNTQNFKPIDNNSIIEPDYDDFMIEEAIKASLEVSSNPIISEPFIQEIPEEIPEEKMRTSCYNPECRNEISEDIVRDHQLLELNEQYPLFCDDCTARYLNGGRFRINRRCPHYETPIKPTSGPCTFLSTSKRPLCQWWYQCNSCYPGKTHVGVCVYCAYECQENGHSLKSRYGVFYCDKGSGYTIPQDTELLSKTNVFDKIMNGDNEW